jgi:1,4-dihydroxy-2-naphthoate octaprenyltransferase
MSKVALWLKAFRLRTLPLSFSTIITGTAMALVQGFWNTGVFLLTLLTTLFLQILSNLANDYGDHVKGTDNADRIGPERALQSGKINKKEMLVAMVLFIVFSLISGIALIYLALSDMPTSVAYTFLALGLSAIAAAIFYTVGKKAYGYHGLGDVFVFLFFGWLGVGGTYFLLTHQMHWTVLLPASGIGLLSTAVLNMNNMRDHDNDKAMGKNTIVVKMGFDAAKIYHLSLMTIAPVLLLMYVLLNYHGIWQFLFVLVSPLFFLNMLKVFSTKEHRALDPELKKIALGTFLMSLLFLVGQILSL